MANSLWHACSARFSGSMGPFLDPVSITAAVRTADKLMPERHLRCLGGRGRLKS